MVEQDPQARSVWNGPGWIRTNDDLLCGLGGNDVISGGPGSDRIFGEEGNDTIVTQDGVFDMVGCASGTDTVRADANDLVGSDCERIERR
jgi:Ca2+-binding RTX toxin-like protein